MKKPEPGHTQDELLESIAQVMGQSGETADGAMTTQDIIDATGIYEKKVRLALRRLLASGRLEETFVLRPQLGRTRSGRPIMRHFPAYQLKPNNEPE